MNDTFWLEHLYASRVDLSRLASAVSATLFGFAVLVGVIPPLFADAQPLPAATVTFDTSTRPITATVTVDAVGVGADDVLSVTIREFVSEPEGVLVGQATRHGDPSGEVSFSQTVAVDAGASYLSVLVAEDPGSAAACGPTAVGSPGCVVLAVPQPTPIASRWSVFFPATSVDPNPGTPSPSDVVPTAPPMEPTTPPPATVSPTSFYDRSGR